MGLGNLAQKVALVVIGILCLADVALSFPEFTRHNYQQCSTCHASPTGGGALTPYGRGISEEALSTWSYTGAASPFYTGSLPSWLMVGGDTRYININSTDRASGQSSHQKFLMQADGELA